MYRPAVILEPDWNRAKKQLSTKPWANELIRAVEKDVLAWSEYDILPSPSEPSGYAHNYFCPQCGEVLVFDPAKPGEHFDSVCNRVYTGEEYDAAWRTLAHNTNVVHMERCAVLLGLGLHTDLAKREILNFAREYPLRYPEYSVHGHGRKGRLMPQALDESVWTISFLRALRWSGLAEELSFTGTEAITKMAEMVVDLLRGYLATNYTIHNISCWLLAAVAHCAVWLNDMELLEWVWSNPIGIHRQIKFGFNADGLWHEGSTSYHYYTLAAILSYFGVAGSQHVEPGLRAKLEAAFAAPLLFAYKDGRLPAYNDSWPTLNIADNADLYEFGANLFSRDAIRATLSAIYQKEHLGKPRTFSRSFNPRIGYTNTTDLTTRASVGALLFGGEDTSEPPVANSKSILLSYAGIGVLKNDHVRLAMRFGPWGSGHDHRDKLDVDVETAAGWQSLDVGTSGYGAEITDLWMRSAAAHNIAIIDGKRQEYSDGFLRSWSDTSVTAEAPRAYPGVLLRRTVTLQDDAWLDFFEIRSEEEHGIDWLFHGDGFFVPDADDDNFETVTFTEDDGSGFACIESVKRVSSVSRVQGRWRCGDVVQQVEITVPAGFDLYWGEAPCNPNGRELGVVIVRGRAVSADIAARFSYR